MVGTGLEYVWNTCVYKICNMFGICLEYVWNMQLEHHSFFEFIWKATLRQSSRSSRRKRISIRWEIAKKLIFSAISSQRKLVFSCKKRFAEFGRMRYVVPTCSNSICFLEPMSGKPWRVKLCATGHGFLTKSMKRLPIQAGRFGFQATTTSHVLSMAYAFP